ncbi:lipopolysaccharide biosynthesis protein [Larkinella bovis]|uniref:Lipopolysaccharide biosynthesis protein n=1 Tax=Larkinella bovis TaxID=683041 RepID=A0ABW0IGB1_9BACT
MSTTKRLLSGTAASWAGIGVTLLTQIALVPIFLTYWDLKVYGIWIAIQALLNALNTLDRGYTDFLEYEFLKLGIPNKHQISYLLWSGIAVVLIISVIETVLLFGASFYFNIGVLLKDGDIESPRLLYETRWSLMIQWIVWIMANINGLLSRSLSAFGYFPRMGWWNVLLSIVNSMVSVGIVMAGGGLLDANIGILIASSLFLLIQFIDIKKLLTKVGITADRYSIKEGFNCYITSFGLSARYFLENFRQQGIRLIILPFLGVKGLTTFSTTRTVANVSQQGLLTITHPLLPELMRFLQERDQDKMEASFGTVWLVLLCILSPGVVILQIIAPYFFAIWTKGQIEFSNPLFATLSIGVLFFALAQPAMAVIVGNNQLKKQIILSVISALIVIVVMAITIPYLGLLGAGIALLIAEIVAAFGFISFASTWLPRSGLVWPVKVFRIALLSVLITFAGILIMVYMPMLKWESFALTISALLWNAIRYYRNMPYIATEKINSLVKRFTVITKTA